MGGNNSKNKFNNNISIEHRTNNTFPFRFPSSKFSTGSAYYYVAKFDYKPNKGDELELRKGDKVSVTLKENDGWWQGRNGDRLGWFPCNYVTDHQNEADSPDYAMPGDIIPKYNDFSIDVLCTVKTLYPFHSQSKEELSFDKDLVLHIIEKPKDDPDWWKARTLRGETGLIPRNYVREINTYLDIHGSALTLNAREWFHGALSRYDCEKLLWNFGETGEFLLRESESKIGDYSLSLRTSKIKHFKIKVDDGCFSIGQRSFSSMEELIRHYKKTAILTTEHGDKIFLKKAFSKTGTR
eukprot:gene10938-12099_t